MKSEKPSRSGTLVCVGNPDQALGLLRLAASVSRRGSAPVHAVRLAAAQDRFPSSASVIREGPPSIRTAALAKHAKRIGVELESLTSVTAGASMPVCSLAHAKRVELILLGHQHRPAAGQRKLIGFAREVMVRAPCDVGVFIEHGLQRVRRVLVPYCRSKQDVAALAFGRRIAERAWAEIVLLHVIDPEDDSPRKRDADRVLEEVFHPHPEARSHVVFKVIRQADRTQAVLDELARGYDLLVIGADPDWGLGERPSGLGAERILRDPAASIVVVHRGAGR